MASKRVTGEELALFTRELAAMHQAGISLVRAVDFYAESGRTRLCEVCADIAVQMQQGRSLSYGLRSYPAIFPDVYVSLVEAGEQSGELRDILHKLADLQERSRKLRQRVVATMTYPLVLLTACIVSILFFVFMVLPAILPLFASLHIKLPWITWVLASLGAAMRRPVVWMLLLAGGAAAWQGGRLFAARLDTDVNLQRRVARLILAIPLVGPLVEKVAAARMMYTIATLMDAGVFMENALLKAGQVSGNAVLMQRMRAAVDDIKEGDRMSVALASRQVFPRAACQVIAAAEESGGLVTSLQRASQMYEDDVEVSLINASALMEPIILLGMGFVSGFIVLSVIIPTVQLLNHL